MGAGRFFSGSYSILGQAGGRPSKDKRAAARLVILGGPSSSHGPNFSREAAFLRASKIKAPDRPPEERGMSQTPLKT
jgi:hypothetical protein